MSDCERLLGAWRLISWEQESERGMIYPLGPDALGQIWYDSSGQMSAQLARANQTRFASDDWNRAMPEERAVAWGSYFGYFGSYTLNEENGTIVHRIEGSWFPNLVATEQIRRYCFEGNRLVLEASMPWGEVRITWEK
jgi:hypothetical protein